MHRHCFHSSFVRLHWSCTHAAIVRGSKTLIGWQASCQATTPAFPPSIPLKCMTITCSDDSSVTNFSRDSCNKSNCKAESVQEAMGQGIKFLRICRMLALEYLSSLKTWRKKIPALEVSVRCGCLAALKACQVSPQTPRTYGRSLSKDPLFRSAMFPDKVRTWQSNEIWWQIGYPINFRLLFSEPCKICKKKPQRGELLKGWTSTPTSPLVARTHRQGTTFHCALANFTSSHKLQPNKNLPKSAAVHSGQTWYSWCFPRSCLTTLQNYG